MAVETMEPTTTESSQPRPSGEPRIFRPFEAAGPSTAKLGPMVIESLHVPWWKSFMAEVSSAFGPQEQFPPLPQYRDPLPGEVDLGPLTIDHLRQSWFLNLRDSYLESEAAKKLPPLQITSKPVAVKSIWGAYNNRANGLSGSAVIHAIVIAAIFLIRPAHIEPKMGSVTLIIPVDINPYLAQLRAKPAAQQQGGGGGGGQNSPLPPSRGRLPRFDTTQLAPPTPVIRNENPKLSVEPTVLVPTDLNVPQINASVFGDPLGNIGPPSAGPGSGGGIGTGRGTGVGSGTGGGVGPGSGGGFGGGVFRVGGGVSAPRLTRKVEPEYSEEARKAKYQGTVVLAVEVWPDGKAHNVRVLRSLGLGLDEKAIEAVQKWEFVPGKKDGAPVKVAASIEVNFRLL